MIGFISCTLASVGRKSGPPSFTRWAKWVRQLPKYKTKEVVQRSGRTLDYSGRMGRKCTKSYRADVYETIPDRCVPNSFGKKRSKELGAEVYQNVRNGRGQTVLNDAVPGRGVSDCTRQKRVPNAQKETDRAMRRQPCIDQHQQRCIKLYQAEVYQTTLDRSDVFETVSDRRGFYCCLFIVLLIVH